MEKRNSQQMWVYIHELIILRIARKRNITVLGVILAKDIHVLYFVANFIKAKRLVLAINHKTMDVSCEGRNPNTSISN